MIRERIKKIFSRSDTPAYDLVGLHSQIRSSEEKEQEFWNTLEELALQGNEKERANALYYIRVDNSELSEQIMGRLLREVDKEFSKHPRSLIKNLIGMVRDHGEKKDVNFCLDTLKWSKNKKDEFIREISFRCVIKHNYKLVENDIKNIVISGSEKKKVDIIAYLIYNEGKEEFEKLLEKWPKEVKEIVAKLKEDINERLKNHYRKNK